MTVDGDSVLLDLLSISQTKPLFSPFGAPLIAMIFRGNASIQQACCNHWECPICGQKRAMAEYRRIVFGAECLADDGRALFFWTLTCRGKEMPLETAEKDYLLWTNRLLTTIRTNAQRQGSFWAYIQVTERQKRLHPHSHLITTFLPKDAIPFAKGSLLPNGRYAKHDCYWSAWFVARNVAVGLGSECDLSAVKSPAAVARYVGKYMFKDSMLTRWPAHWRRVRYSQNWPTPPYIKAEYVRQLQKPADWRDAEAQHKQWVCETDGIYQWAQHRFTHIVQRVSNVDFR